MRILLIILMMTCEPEPHPQRLNAVDSVQVGPPSDPNIDPNIE